MLLYLQIEPSKCKQKRKVVLETFLFLLDTFNRREKRGESINIYTSTCTECQGRKSAQILQKRVSSRVQLFYKKKT